MQNILNLIKVNIANAQASSGNVFDGKLKNPLGEQNNNIYALFATFVDFIITIAIPVGVCIVFYAGFKIVLAMGDMEKLKKGKDMLVWTLVGLVLIISAKVLVTFLKNTFTQIGVTV